MAVHWVSVPYLATTGFTAHPTALMRDTSKLVAIGPSTPMFAKSQIHVYSPSGEGLLLLGVRPACFANSCATLTPLFFSGNKQRSFALGGLAMRD